TANFNPNNLLEDVAFTDSDTKDATEIRKVFDRTPYDSRSFLGTYQSNGIQAADAVARSARTYGINPIVFLVYLEMTEGLVGLREYPVPPNRVEYVFQCGCYTRDNCEQALAGLDRQLDCLGRQLRTAFDDIVAKRQSVAGWGKGKESLTIDGIGVTP